MIKSNHQPNHCLYMLLCLVIAVGLWPGAVLAQLSSEETIFTSINLSQWSITGRVTPQSTDTTLRFSFGFDEDNPPHFPPDTTELEIVSEFDLASYDNVRIVYETYDVLPHIDSWVDGNIRFFIKHEYQPNWTEVTDDLSSLAGWAHQLHFKMKVAVRSNVQHPGAFVLDKFRIVGNRR